MKKSGMLHHLEINVGDLKQSLKFWQWLLGELGYMRYQKWKEGESWKLGMTYVVFVQTEANHSSPRYHRKHVGLNHIAFHVADTTQLEKILQQAKRRKITMLYHERYPHAGDKKMNTLYLEDPDRIKVELIASQ
jgi:catechol 2,3-dioxygenase-like lactoylglutathione lyase family enzyme